MNLSVSCDLQFKIEDETTLILMLRPYYGAQQWITHSSYKVEPVVHITESTDSFGNFCQRLVAPKGDLCIKTSAEVLTATTVDKTPGACFVDIHCLPDSVLRYLLPSRYCESDRFGNLAHEIVSDALPGYDQVNTLSEWVHQTINYVPGSGDKQLSATEVYAQGYGVCRDLAQLAIALCRSISIPARLVVGYLYLLDPMDLHAWFEAYIGGRWYIFDPTQSNLCGGRVVVAMGRDAADVAIFHQFGQGCTLTNMKVKVNFLN